MSQTWHRHRHRYGGRHVTTSVGIIDGVNLNVEITPNGTLRYTVAATWRDTVENPVPVGLTIGGNCGKASVTAKITP